MIGSATLVLNSRVHYVCEDGRQLGTLLVGFLAIRKAFFRKFLGRTGYTCYLIQALWYTPVVTSRCAKKGTSLKKANALFFTSRFLATDNEVEEQ